MSTKSVEKSEGYRIGAVARLTGISADNLRVWERRYQAVTPARTDSGDRYYSPEDVSRLKLIKRLLDSGDSISSIAILAEDKLQQRLSVNQPEFKSAPEQSCHVVVIGQSLGKAMLAEQESLTQITLTRIYTNTASFLAQSDKDVITGVVPERQFEDETLARLADITTTVKCECPQHLSELISSLSAFETYSSECESRNAQDAALHKYLNETASRARFMLETALKKVIEVDNIKL